MSAITSTSTKPQLPTEGKPTRKTKTSTYPESLKNDTCKPHHLAESKDTSPTFESLACEDEQKMQIIELIIILGTVVNSFILTKMPRINSIKENIKNIHPLIFISYIFSNDSMKKNKIKEKMIFMEETNTFFFKSWFVPHTRLSYFINELSENLNKEKNHTKDYIEDFVKSLSNSEEEQEKIIKRVTPFFENNNWENLVTYLINREIKT